MFGFSFKLSKSNTNDGPKPTLGYVAPKDKLEGRAEEIWRQRDEQLENARKWRAKERRRVAAKEMVESLVKRWSVSNFN